MVRHGSSSSRGFGGVRRRSGSRGRGLARDARGGQEGGPRGRERSEERGALLLAHEALPRARLPGDRDEGSVDGHGDVGVGHDASLGRHRLGLGASALVSGRWTRKVLAAEEQRDITCSSLWEAWQRRGCQLGQYRVMMLAVGVLYGHLLGAQRALAAAAATQRAAPLVLRNVVLCEMEVV